jgi:hypothetical protein
MTTSARTSSTGSNPSIERDVQRAAPVGRRSCRTLGGLANSLSEVKRVNINIQADFMTIAGFAIGIVGLLIAIWQIISARNVRKMYREKCETRCKDLVETVGQLAQTVTQACKIKDENLDELITGKCDPGKVVRPLRQLSDQIHAIDLSKNQLVRFCERLNDEHLEEFDELVFPDIRSKFADYARSPIADGRLSNDDQITNAKTSLKGEQPAKAT